MTNPEGTNLSSPQNNLNGEKDSPESKDKNTPRSSKLVSMRLQPETIDAINYIRDVTGIDNRTQIAASAIALARWWIERKETGAKLYAEYPDGERERVVIPKLEPPNNGERRHNGRPTQS